jgi:hypothetical protein
MMTKTDELVDEAYMAVWAARDAEATEEEEEGGCKPAAKKARKK